MEKHIFPKSAIFLPNELMLLSCLGRPNCIPYWAFLQAIENPTGVIYFAVNVLKKTDSVENTYR